jgi:D-alanine transaminase
VHIEDRGYQFADGVYEVISVVAGRLVDPERHLRRLHRSLGELRIPMPIADAALGIVVREVVRRNGVDNGIVYLQVTRGVAPREHAFPKAAKPTLVVTSRRSRPPDPRLGNDGIAVITIPDIRWQRCDIKSVALIANVLGKQAAREAGAYEAWQVDGNGEVTEGTSTNAWIVTGESEVVTRAADTAILNGVTRLAIFDIIGREGYRLVERPFTVAEAMAAREAFLTSTTADLLPVVRIDGAPVGEGRPGPLAQKLRAAYFAHAGVAA